MYKLGEYPFDLICPIEILWKPSKESTGKNSNDKRPAQNSSPTPKTRVVWIRCHPAAFGDVFSNIQSSISSVLQKSGTQRIDVELTDLRDCFNIFEIIGPKSSQVVTGALTPLKDQLAGEFKQVGLRSGF